MLFMGTTLVDKLSQDSKRFRHLPELIAVDRHFV